MNKSILILDNNPEKCEECQFLRYIPIDQKQCNASIRLIKKTVAKTKLVPIEAAARKTWTGSRIVILEWRNRWLESMYR